MKTLWSECISKVKYTDTIRSIGRVNMIVGMIIEALNISAPIGSVCKINIGRNREPVICEVVGFREDTALLMPYGDMEGLAPGQSVSLFAENLTIPTGNQLLGRVINGLGQPIDGKGPLRNESLRRVHSAPPFSLKRARIDEPLATGVRAIDGLVTVAKGQRMGIFAGSGVGKSVLMGMISRNSDVDVNVVALIGERGREVKEFIERDLGPEGLARSVVIVVTSDESAVMRARGAETAMAVAESFRDSQKNVMFLMDSVTRYAMALREIGLATGEPPTTKGYTPSVFAALPKLCERAGCAETHSITALFTVLIEGDDIHDPIGDAMRSILDGHIMLSRDLARENHYPAIDVLGSVSRLKTTVAKEDHIQAGNQISSWLKIIEDNKDLLTIGAYTRGNDPILDKALEEQEKVNAFLRQGEYDPATWETTTATLLQLGRVD
ncbi:MAG: FliI/YscN family ATPase [bacterium]|nr:FliI/YscN family ATPase [bacterium]